MLVLTRRVGESIRIGDDIIVSVIGASGPTVRIAIAAPKEVVILRTELDERNDEETATEPKSA